MDEHFRTAPFEDNIPVLLGLTGVWNTTFLGYPSMAILPYTQALSKLAPHIQQVPPGLPSIAWDCCVCCEEGCTTGKTVARSTQSAFLLT